MLQTNSVSESLLDTLLELNVGGTALALQIGHRISEDIDLFTRQDIDKNKERINNNSWYLAYEKRLSI